MVQILTEEDIKDIVANQFSLTSEERKDVHFTVDLDTGVIKCILIVKDPPDDIWENNFKEV